MADPGIQHAVHSNREDAEEPQMLGVLGEHGREHAWEGYIPEEQCENLACAGDVKRHSTTPEPGLLLNATALDRSPDTPHLLPTTPEVARGVAGPPDSGPEVRFGEVAHRYVYSRARLRQPRFRLTSGWPTIRALRCVGRYAPQ